MSGTKPIQTALVSVFNKTGLADGVTLLHELGVKLFSTGGTADSIRALGLPVTDISEVTHFPSILGGRVKTLHPGVFGGILARRDDPTHLAELDQYKLVPFDLVFVDLYPFGQTLASGATHAEIIEKIDIGGVSLLRAAAKNCADVLVIPSYTYLETVCELAKQQNGNFSYEQRLFFAQEALAETAAYDRQISDYFNTYNRTNAFAREQQPRIGRMKPLRYGENPHQTAFFEGDWSELLTQHHGKDISYNNLLDIDGALHLITEFDDPTYAIFKHTTPCGLASADTALTAWERALACDPLSAFGGIIITNQTIDLAQAQELDKLFFEVLLTPAFAPDALALLQGKKTRILLTYTQQGLPTVMRRSVLNGALVQDVDQTRITVTDLKVVTQRQPNPDRIADLLFADAAAKHLKSNSIALVRDRQLIGSGAGHTSRIDALQFAINKARAFNFDLTGAVLGSDGFFPFADAVHLAHEAGIDHILQPGGSVRDTESIEYCNAHDLCMVFTGIRHFKH
jgi:phosphoribosylaminoimidazolecarboxamide formyltransferase/IMP cyclohydrolase